MQNKGKLKATLFTLFSAVFNSALLMLFNLIYNNLMIRHYGSSATGLISTLTQFVSMFTIIEGGFSVAAIVASYEPIVKKEYDKLNNILFTIGTFLRRIAVIYTVVCLIAGGVYVQFIDSPLSAVETYSLLILTVVTTAMSLSSLSKYSIVLAGHNQKYIVILISALSKTATWILSVVLIVLHQNILLVYLMNFLNVALNVIFLKWYEKKHYPYITYAGQYQKNIIKGTKDILFQKITSTIFTSTDLVLISVGLSLSIANVYNLYNQIFQAIFNYLLSMCDAPMNSFGQLFCEGNKERALRLFHIFEKVVQLVSTAVLAAVGMSIIAFMRIYTKQITDENYIIPALVFLFFTYFFAKLNNAPFGQIINATGNFRIQNIQCAIAAVVNLVLSVAFMKIWGVEGIIFGSVCGTLVVLIANVVRSYKEIITESSLRCFVGMTVNYVLGMGMIVLAMKIDVSPSSYIVWGGYAVGCMIVSGLATLALNFLIDTNHTKQTVSYFLSKVLQKIGGKCRTR